MKLLTKIQPPDLRGWHRVVVQVELGSDHYRPIGWVLPNGNGRWIARLQDESLAGIFRSRDGAAGALVRLDRRRDPGETRVWRADT